MTLILPGMEDLPPEVDLLNVDSCQGRWQVQHGEVFILSGKTGPHVLVCGDSRDPAVAEIVDREVRHDGVSVFVPDPPYGIGHNARPQAGKSRKSDKGKTLPVRRSDVELDGGDVYDPSWMPLWRDIFCPEAVYLFASWESSWRWKIAMQMNRWPPQARITWDMMHFGMGDKSRYGNQTEDILCWYEKGKAPNWLKREGNVWQEPRGVCLEGGQVGHPTPKPFGLYRRMILHATQPADVVIDMFAGSCSALIVADGLGRRFGGADLSPRYCALGLERAERYGIKLVSRSHNARIAPCSASSENSSNDTSASTPAPSEPPEAAPPGSGSAPPTTTSP